MKSAAARCVRAANREDTVQLAPTVSGPYHRITMTRDAGPLVLIVEDDLETRRFFSDVLTESGFRVDQAHNGHQALEKALASNPALVITDIAVPGIDGIELCLRLRADARTSDIPILAVTGYGDRRYPDRAIQAGADYVLIKPCDPETIVAEARRLLERGGPTSAVRASTGDRAV